MTRTQTRYTNGRYKPRNWWTRKDARNWMVVLLMVVAVISGGLPW